MIMFENYRVIKSDKLNYRIESLKDVKVKKDGKETGDIEKKWLKTPNYYPSVLVAINALIKEEFINDLVDGEEISIKDFIKLVDSKFSDLKEELEK